MQFLSWWNYGFEAMAINQWDNYGNISRLFIHSFICIYLSIACLFIDLFMFFKEHPNLLRVSIPFFYFATTKTPVEIFLLQNDSCRYVPAHVFRPRAKKVSALSIHELRLATYTLIVILELVLWGYAQIHH